MTRQEIIQKSASYGRAVSWTAWPCIIVSISAVIGWMLTHSSSDIVDLMFLVAISAPIALCL